MQESTVESINVGLVIWAAVGPLLGTAAAGWIDLVRENRRREAEKEQQEWEYEKDQKQRKREHKKARADEMREQMRDSYARFLSVSSKIFNTLETGDRRDEELELPAAEPLIAEITTAFHDVLLVASEPAAEAAVVIFDRTRQSLEIGFAVSKDSVGEARTTFVREARLDLANPLARSLGPAGGKAATFDLDGVGL